MFPKRKAVWKLQISSFTFIRQHWMFSSSFDLGFVWFISRDIY